MEVQHVELARSLLLATVPRQRPDRGGTLHVKKSKVKARSDFTLELHELETSNRLLGQKACLNLIAEILFQKVEADTVDDKAHHPRQPLNEFILDFMTAKYGLIKLAKDHMITFTSTMRRFFNEHPRIHLFAELCGAINPALATHYTDFYVDTLSHVMRQSNTKDLYLEKSTSEVLLLLGPCLEVLESKFRTLSSEELHALQEKVCQVAKAPNRNEDSPTRVLMDSYMGVVMHQYSEMMRHRRERLSRFNTLVLTLVLTLP